jgi:hypothetical protein
MFESRTMQSKTSSFWLSFSRLFGALRNLLVLSRSSNPDPEPRMAQQHIELKHIGGMDKVNCWRVTSRVLRECGFASINQMPFGRGANASSDAARVSLFFEVPMGAQDEMIARRILVQYVTTERECAEALGALCRKLSAALGAD